MLPWESRAGGNGDLPRIPKSWGKEGVGNTLPILGRPSHTDSGGLSPDAAARSTRKPRLTSKIVTRSEKEFQNRVCVPKA